MLLIPVTFCYINRQAVEPILKRDDALPKTKKLESTEIVMNEIKGDVAEPVEAESSVAEKSMTSIGE